MHQIPNDGKWSWTRRELSQTFVTFLPHKKKNQASDTNHKSKSSDFQLFHLGYSVLVTVWVAYIPGLWFISQRLVWVLGLRKQTTWNCFWPYLPSWSLILGWIHIFPTSHSQNLQFLIFKASSLHVLFPFSTNDTLTIKLGDLEVQTIRYKINYKDVWYNMENIANIL